MKAIGLLVLLTAAPLSAQTARPETAEISTSGQGEVVLVPDQVRLHLGIEVRAGTAAAASSQVGARADRARQAIRSKGILPDSVRVTNFDVSPNYDYEHDRKLIDYRGSAIIEVTVRPPGKMGSVIDTALVSGVSAVQNMEFASDSVAVARNRAIGIAVEKARRDADALARAGGGRLGRLLSLSTSGGETPVFARQAMSFAKAGAPEVERDVVVSVGVQARWEFLPGTP